MASGAVADAREQARRARCEEGDATLRIRQLQKDVKDAEEAELRRFEVGAMAGR